MVTRDGFVKILDFGLAKLTDSVSGSDEHSRLPTVSGTSPGSSSERSDICPRSRCRGQPWTSGRIFSLFGSILYEMGTGRRAFHRKTGGRHSGGDYERGAGAHRRDQSPDSRAFVLDRGAVPGEGSGRSVRVDQGPHAGAGGSPEPPCRGGGVEADGRRRSTRGSLWRESKEIPLEPARPPGVSRNARLGVAAAVVVARGRGRLALAPRVSRSAGRCETATPEIARLVDAEEFAKAGALRGRPAPCSRRTRRSRSSGRRRRWRSPSRACRRAPTSRSGRTAPETRRLGEPRQDAAPEGPRAED